jgi:hypothetical protein
MYPRARGRRGRARGGFNPHGPVREIPWTAANVRKLERAYDAVLARMGRPGYPRVQPQRDANVLDWWEAYHEWLAGGY